MRYAVVIEKAEGNYGAYVPDLPGCVATGDARVDPKDLLNTCRYCDLQPLCRVYERVNALGEAEESE